MLNSDIIKTQLLSILIIISVNELDWLLCTHRGPTKPNCILFFSYLNDRFIDEQSIMRERKKERETERERDWF